MIHVFPQVRATFVVDGNRAVERRSCGQSSQAEPLWTKTGPDRINGDIPRPRHPLPCDSLVMEAPLESSGRELGGGSGFLVGLGINLVVAMAAWAAFMGDGPLYNDEIRTWTTTIVFAAIGIGGAAAFLSRTRRQAAAIVCGCIGAVLLEVFMLFVAILANSA